MRHENIVKLIDVSLEEEQLFLIFEYLSMDLKHFLDSKKREKTKLTPDMVKSYTFQILQVINSISIHFPSWYSVVSRRWNWKFREKHFWNPNPELLLHSSYSFLPQLSASGSGWDLASPLPWKIVKNTLYFSQFVHGSGLAKSQLLPLVDS